MTTEEIKRDIHQLIDSVQDNLTLVDLHAVVALVIEQQGMLLDADTDFLKNRMNSALEQVSHTTYTTNEAMKQEVRQWLSK